MDYKNYFLLANYVQNYQVFVNVAYFFNTTKTNTSYSA